MQQWREIHDVQLAEAYRQISGRVLAGERWFAEREAAGDLVLKTTVQFRSAQHESRCLTLNLYEFTTQPGFFYYLPLLITIEALAEQIAYFQRGNLYFYDGIPTPAYPELLGQLLTQRQSVKTLNGDSEFLFQATSDFMTPDFQLKSSSSNSLLFVSHHYLLKNYRRIYPGMNPELRLGWALTAAGTQCVPKIWGSISCLWDQTTEYTLGILQELVVHQGTGWEVWGRLLADCTTAQEDELVRQATSLGRILAELHQEMARIAIDSNQINQFDAPTLHERINKLSATTETELATVAPDLLPRVRGKITQISAGIIVEAGLGQLFRIHGDLHLEQVLKTATGWKVIDFEGEPLKTIVERESDDSPLKDLAALLRSVGYRVHTVPGAGEREALVQMALVDGYCARYREHQGEFLPAEANFGRLLDLFQLERVIYELSYEAKYRPDWVHIPLAGLERLVGR